MQKNIAGDKPSNTWWKIYSLFSPPHKLLKFTLARVNERNMNIAYEKFQQVMISSVLSSTLMFQRKSSLWKMYLAKSGEILEKMLSFFLAFILSISYFFYLYFAIDLFMSYFFISPQWKVLNICINDLKYKDATVKTSKKQKYTSSM